MHATVVRQSVGIDVAESASLIHGARSRPDVAHSLCLVGFFTSLNNRSVSLSHRTAPWTQTHGQTGPNWEMDG